MTMPKDQEDIMEGSMFEFNERNVNTYDEAQEFLTTLKGSSVKIQVCPGGPFVQCSKVEIKRVFRNFKKNRTGPVFIDDTTTASWFFISGDILYIPYRVI